MAEQPPDSDDGSALWNARCEALAALFGPPAENVWHADLPGLADVLVFPNWIAGDTYVTADLTGSHKGQIPNSLGTYELMICSKEADSRMPALISNIAPYTCKSLIEVGHLMNLKGYFGDSPLTALLFTHPTVDPVHFELFGHHHGILLAIGITAEEHRFSNATSPDELLMLLTAGKVYPYTIPDRASVWLPPLKKKPFFRTAFLQMTATPNPYERCQVSECGNWFLLHGGW